ncbi:hypothetical protein BRC97_06670 [Halobacteriales archaeon QS_6_71_20]|nr:MAG: hypothetical protein BRC97_06670 [Halobacteriales archaeon QS_6_71_20]
MRALALAGALDPLRDASGDDPALTALATTLTAWLGLRERDPSFVAAPSTPTPGPDAASAPDADPAVAAGPTDADRRPATVGAAVACERFDVDLGQAASLAGCSRDAVAAALAARPGTDPIDPLQPEGGDR